MPDIRQRVSGRPKKAPVCSAPGASDEIPDIRFNSTEIADQNDSLAEAITCSYCWLPLPAISPKSQ
jgi:hypothetical protein